MRLASSRKGISEIISALLVICITVSAATLFSAYASGLMGRITKPVSEPYTEQLTLDYYTWPCPNNVCGSLSITIRNDGAATINFADFFMQGMKNTSDVTPTSCNSLQVQGTGTWSLFSCALTFPVPTGLTVTPGVQYTIKLVAKDGTIFAFSCIAGSYTQ